MVGVVGVHKKEECAQNDMLRMCVSSVHVNTAHGHIVYLEGKQLFVVRLPGQDRYSTSSTGRILLSVFCVSWSLSPLLRG